MSTVPETESELPEAVYTLAEIAACLKRIRKSVELWTKTKTKEQGRQGYLNFVQNYIQ